MTRALKPGSPVRGSRTGKPVMALLDLVGRRWALRVVWELRSGALTSRALRDACGGVSPTVLQERTGELRAAGLVELEPQGGYALTALGRELFDKFTPLVAWAERWSAAMQGHKGARAARARPPRLGPSRSKP
jgi:DNA-binding HxlR family transcriptional regulator